MLKTKESRMLWGAILASLFLHLAIAYSLAAFGGMGAPVVPVEDRPPELTLVDLPAAPPKQPVNAPYMETDDAKKSAETPKEKTFESNANSIGASELPANGDNPLPSQEGKERPFVQTETNPLSLAMKGEQPQPEPKTTPTAEVKATDSPPPATAPPAKEKTTPTPIPQLTPPLEQFAMLTSTPPPAFTPPETEATPAPTPAISPVPRPQPERPDSSFRALKEQTRLTGRITNRGPSSVDAVETPMGRYYKVITDAIGSRWYYYIGKKTDLIKIGTVVVSAEIDADGHLQDVEVVSNTANEAFANVCLQSFQEAQIPPIPPELVPLLSNGRVTVQISFNMVGQRW